MSKSTQRTLIAAVALALAGGLIPATQAAAGIYVGGSVGQSKYDGFAVSDLDDGSVLTGSVDDSDTGYKAFVGWRFFKFFAIEAAWNDFGMAAINATSDGSGAIYAAGPVTATAELTGVSVSAVLTLPVAKRITVLAKYGTLEWDADIAISNSAIGTQDDSDSGSDNLLGVGVSINTPGPGSVRIEWERIEIDSDDVTLTSVGYAFKF